jgi:hypothetical protein
MKDFVTTKVQVQLNAVAMEAAAPRILDGKSSPIISHGIGPNPAEKETTYTMREMSGIQPGGSVLLDKNGCLLLLGYFGVEFYPSCLAKKYPPKARRLAIIPAELMYNSSFRPRRSINRLEVIVAAILTIPI